MADLVYLVMQVDIPSLRNASRLISHLRRQAGGQVHGVSRIEVGPQPLRPAQAGNRGGQIGKSLALPLKWKVPNDYAGVRRSIDAGIALASGSSPVAEALHHMARAACGKPIENGKKKRWGLFS